MITNCGGGDPNLYGLEVGPFFIDVGTLMLLVFPTAICVVLWKVFVSNRISPRGNILSLGLDHTTATHTELYGRSVPWRALFLRLLVAGLTFQLGVFAFELNWYVQGLLQN